MSGKQDTNGASEVWIPVGSQKELLRIFARIVKQFSAVEEERVSGIVQCLDTFDWRILGTGDVLMRVGGEMGLFRIGGGSLDLRTAVASRLRPRFWSDLPEGELQCRLRKVAGIRALLPAGRFRMRFSRLSIPGDDERVVCRLHLLGARPLAGGNRSAEAFCGIRVLPVKKERKAARVVEAFLAESGLSPGEGSLHPLFAAMEASGRRPFDYTSKIVLELAPEMTAGDAARRIHLASIATAERNIPGTIEDLDAEFLHDFRVALRRNRSALSLIKGVFPDEVAKEFRESLAGIQKMTNRLRDLDVYLMEEERFRELLPEELHIGLDLFFSRLREERQEAFVECRDFLKSEAPRSSLEKWREYLASPARVGEAVPPNAGKPVLEVARKLLAKRFRRILRDGRKIDSSSPDARVHELRIQFKKLRYLMEFFGTLFAERKVSFLIDRCRKLQNTLGRLNDFSVQESWVAQRRKADKESPDQSMETSASLGALLTELRRAQRKERKKFARAFQKFDNPKVEKTVSELF